MNRTRFFATLFLVDPTTRRLRPLVLDDRRRVVIVGTSAPLTLGSALTYLEGVFGAFGEIANACQELGPVAPVGQPFIINRSNERSID